MLTGYVNLNDQQNYQLIYATQEFLSFYCIYAKFELSIDNLFLQSIELHLENYNGSQYKFQNSYIDITSFAHGILKLGIKTTLGGNSSKIYHKFKAPIDVKKLKSVFITRNTSHFENLSNYSERQIIDITNEVDEEYHKEIKKIISNKRTGVIIAAGRNCRVSYIQVTKPY